MPNLISADDVGLKSDYVIGYLASSRRFAGFVPRGRVFKPDQRLQ
jgi:hypothetical protein